MQAGDQRTRAISEVGDEHDAPRRTPRWERGHVDLGGEVEQRSAIAGRRDRDLNDMVRQIEVRINLPAQCSERAVSVGDPLDEARHGGDSGRHLAPKKVEVDGPVEYRQQTAAGVEPRVGADAPHQRFLIRHRRFEVVGRRVAHCRLAAREAEVVGLARRERASEFLRRRIVRLPCPLRK